MPPLTIKDIKVIMTQPAGSQLLVVKVQTSEPGLHGVGCATHQERPYAVAAAIEKHIKPFILGVTATKSRTSGRASTLPPISAAV